MQPCLPRNVPGRRRHAGGTTESKNGAETAPGALPCILELRARPHGPTARTAAPRSTGCNALQPPPLHHPHEQQFQRDRPRPHRARLCRAQRGRAHGIEQACAVVDELLHKCLPELLRIYLAPLGALPTDTRSGLLDRSYRRQRESGRAWPGGKRGTCGTWRQRTSRRPGVCLTTQAASVVSEATRRGERPSRSKRSTSAPGMRTVRPMRTASMRPC